VPIQHGEAGIRQILQRIERALIVRALVLHGRSALSPLVGESWRGG